MWLELERFIRAHAVNSAQHKKVLECLLECKGSSIDTTDQKIKEEKPDLSVADQAMQDFDKWAKGHW